MTGVYPFAFGSATLPGLAKLAEKDEVGQIIGKLMMTGGSPSHWSGLNLHDELMDELGDLSAAIMFMKRHAGLCVIRIEARAEQKLALFEQWHREQAQTPEPGQ